MTIKSSFTPLAGAGPLLQNRGGFSELEHEEKRPVLGGALLFYIQHHHLANPKLLFSQVIKSPV